MENIPLSPYGEASSTPSPVNRMMAAFAADFRDGMDTNLGVGYVNERTIPIEAMTEALDGVHAHPERHRQPWNYGGPAGSPTLIAAIHEFHERHGIGGLTGHDLERQRTVIGASGASSILEAIASVLPKGIVLTADPMYYIYCNYLMRAGFEVATVPEDDEGIRIDALEKLVNELGDRAEAIRFIYVVTVNNPSCVLLNNRRRRELLAFTESLSRRLGRRVPLILDKAYELLLHDPDVPPPESLLPHDSQGLVYEVGTLSKILAPALRVGYIMGADGPFIEALVQRNSDIGFSAPLIMQEMAAHILDHHGKAQLETVNAGYREKANRVREAIETDLGPFLDTYRGGQAGFYFYLTFSDIATGEGSPFFRFLTRTTGQAHIDGPLSSRKPRVIYIPGEYCVHPAGSMAQIGARQLRLSYGFEESDRIIEAIRMMRHAALYARRQA